MKRPTNKGKALQERINQLIEEKGIAEAISYMGDKDWFWFVTHCPQGQEIARARIRAAQMDIS